MGSIRKRKDSQNYEARAGKQGVDAISRSFASLKEAKQWLKAKEYDLCCGLTIKEAGTMTIGDAIEDYFAASAYGVISIKIQSYKLTPIRALLGEKYIRHLTKPCVQEYIEKLKVTKVWTYMPAGNLRKPGKTFLSGGSIKQLFTALKKLLFWHAERHNYFLRAELFKKIKLPKENDGRERRLEEGELQRLISTADRYRFSSPLVILFAIVTAMRSQEIAKAQWSDIIRGGSGLLVRKGNCKTGFSRVVPLSIVARDILQVLKERKAQMEQGPFPEKPSPFIFSEFEGVSKKLYGHVKTVRKNADMLSFRFHDCRHEGISMYAQAGAVSQTELMSMSGHKLMATFLRYANMLPNLTADKL